MTRSDEMNELRRAWVTALRSGRYTQGQGSLRHTASDGNRFCCLGVLCDITQTPWLNNGVWVARTSDHPTEYSSTNLPRSLRERVGISVTMEGKLIDMNDGYSKFPHIADYLERELGIADD